MLTKGQTEALDEQLMNFADEFATQEAVTTFEVLQIIHAMLGEHLPPMSDHTLVPMKKCVQCEAYGNEPICPHCGVVRN